MRVLIFDTETSGFPEKGGKLLQFAAHVCDLSFDPPLTVQEFSTLVKCPDPVQEGAFEVHGISQEMTQTGLDPIAICKWITGVSAKCDLIVAHNSQFDIKVMDFEFRRAGMGGFNPENVFCTMKASTDLCELPGRYGNYKWPKLEEALPILCGVSLEGAHDALADTRGCRLLFLELAKRGLVPGVAESIKSNAQEELI